MFKAIAVIVLAGATATAAQLPKGAVVDLTHSYDESTIFWPTEPAFALEKVAGGETDKGFYYASNRFCTPEHGGTHIDAPIHFHKDRHTVDAIPLERLMGPAVVVDVSEKCAADRDYQVAAADLVAWEKRHGRIPKGAILFLRTGFGKYWPDRVRYMGTDERGAQAVAKLHFPGLHPEAAKWLVAERAVNAVGIDTPSMDYGQSSLFQSHVTLCGANIPGFENVANLDRLPEKGATVIALPMKIKGGSGGPLRIVAFVP